MNAELSYKDLIVWQKSIRLVTEIYRVTEKFPRAETYGLASQMQRAAISIPSNIAEGTGRSTKKDFLQFLHVALGSATELETQLIIACNLEYITEQELARTATDLSEVCKMLHGLMKKLRLPDADN